MSPTVVIPANREAIGEANAGIQTVYMLDSRFRGTAEGSGAANDKPGVSLG